MTLVAPSASVASRALDRADAAADPAGQRGADVRDERFVVAGALRRVEIDQLDLRVTARTRDPRVDIVGLDREPLALHELDDACRPGDRSMESASSLTGTPALEQVAA